MVSLYQYVGLSIQKQSFTVQPNLLMYTLFKMFYSHLLLESWEYDDYKNFVLSWNQKPPASRCDTWAFDRCPSEQWWPDYKNSPI